MSAVVVEGRLFGAGVADVSAETPECPAGERRTFRAYGPDQVLLMAAVLSVWVPEGDLAHFVSDLVEGALGLLAVYACYGDERGFPPYDPRLMLKLLIYGYANGVCSSRKLEPGDLPRRRGADAVRGPAARLPLDRPFSRAPSGGALGALRAGAALGAQARALLEQAEQVDAEGDERFGPDNRGDELPQELARRESRLERIRAARAALEAQASEREQRRRAGLEAEARKPRSAPGGRDPFAPKPTDQRNFTDPESEIMKSSDGSSHQCFNGRAIVDGKAQVILAADASAQAPDTPQLEAARAEPRRDRSRAARGRGADRRCRLLLRGQRQEQPRITALTPTSRGAQGQDQAGPGDLRPPQGDRRAGLRPAADRPGSQAPALSRQAGRAHPVAL